MVDVEVEWDDLDAAFAAVEAECEAVVRGITVMAWNGILHKTPQYDGRMVVSWTYSIGSPVFEDRSDRVSFVGPRKTEIGKFAPSQGLYAGHPRAIRMANAINANAQLNFKLGETVFISNGVDHGEGPYSGAIEDGEISLRAVNLPGAPARRTLDRIGVRFAEDVSAGNAAQLKSLMIGPSNAAGDS